MTCLKSGAVSWPTGLGFLPGGAEGSENRVASDNSVYQLTPFETLGTRSFGIQNYTSLSSDRCLTAGLPLIARHLAVTRLRTSPASKAFSAEFACREVPDSDRPPIVIECFSKKLNFAARGGLGVGP
jgi:hypothetical protein